MSHISTLLMNRIRGGLEKLCNEGVGYIDGETTDKIYYNIDNRLFEIRIRETESNEEY